MGHGLPIIFDARRTSPGTMLLASSREGGGSAYKAIDCVPTIFNYCLTRCIVGELWSCSSFEECGRRFQFFADVRESEFKSGPEEDNGRHKAR